MKINVNDSLDYLASLQEFNAGNLTAHAENGAYVVKSYGVVIGRAVRLPNGEIMGEVFPQKYSTTTTRHENITRRAWAH